MHPEEGNKVGESMEGMSYEEQCPGFSWDELIFLPVAAVFWIKYKKNVDNTSVFSSCCEIKDFYQFLILS